VFGLGPATRVYLAVGATDLRKGFEGLFGLVKDRLGLEPLSGHVVCFCNRSRSRIKVLFWDGSGLWLCAKRLEKGRFNWPSAQAESVRVKLSQEELTLLLGGIDLKQTKSRNWYRKTLSESEKIEKEAGN
jgi:transposase